MFLSILFLSGVSTATAGNVLFVVSPRLPSHFFGMEKFAQEIASRQHNVLVKPLLSCLPSNSDPGLRTGVAHARA